MPKVLRSNSTEDGANRPAITDHSTVKHRPLDELADSVGYAHDVAGEWKTTLADRRKDFFNALTSHYRQQTRAMKTVIVHEADPVKAEERVLTYNPGWLIVESRPEDDARKFILEEDPEFIGHQIVTGTPEEPGWVVTRTIRSGSTMIDLDRMKLEQPELFKQVTRWPPWAEAAREYMSTSNWREWLIENDIQPIPRDDLTPKQVEQIRGFVYENKKTVALNVREAKAEDYEAA